jgi:hypothetical protein
MAHTTTRGTATLVGISAAEGQTCQDCGRELTARMFQVRTAEGHLLVLGRRCAAYATGYPTSRLEHEARRIALLDAMDRAHAALTLPDYLRHAATIDTSTGQEFLDFHTAHHAELVARYATT